MPALISRTDLEDSIFIKLSQNTADQQIISCIESAVKFDVADYLPAQLVLDLYAIHLTSDTLSTQQNALLTYFNANLKDYYCLLAYMNYIYSPDAIQTASGFRTFKELQSDKVSADAYAQILHYFEKLCKKAMTLALAQLKKDAYKIGDTVYNETESAKTPNKQLKFQVVLPCDNEYPRDYNL